ncbi:unnamed protein product [Caenorhabditis brenneri]
MKRSAIKEENVLIENVLVLLDSLEEHIMEQSIQLCAAVVEYFMEVFVSVNQDSKEKNMMCNTVGVADCDTRERCDTDGGFGWKSGWADRCRHQCSGKRECLMDRHSSKWSCRCQAGSTGIDRSILVEMHCDNGLDDDSDGLIDCVDPECCSSSSRSSESVRSAAASPTEVLMRLPPMFNAYFAQKVASLKMEKSVQSYTDASEFNESLISVTQGRVICGGNSGGSDDLFTSLNKSTVPLVGVRVSDSAHPFYGFTLTRDDGYFDLTSVKKSVYVPPRQIIHIDDIVLYRQTGASAHVPSMAPAKCSPTTRKLPEVVLISNWQYTSDDQTDSCLVCDSSRSPAAPSTLLIGLLEDRIDEDLRKVHVNTRIAGR